MLHNEVRQIARVEVDHASKSMMSLAIDSKRWHDAVDRSEPVLRGTCQVAIK